MRAAGLVDEVLAYARGGSMGDGSESSDLADVLETAVAGAWGHAARCGVALEMRSAVLRLPAVNCPPIGLRLLLVHLLRRSAEACSPGARLVAEADLCGSMATVAIHRVAPQGSSTAAARQGGREPSCIRWAGDLTDVCVLADEVGASCTEEPSGPVVWMRLAEIGAWGNCPGPE